MHDWKIWYDDGSAFSNADGDPKDAPIDGVQAILQWLPLGNYNIIPPADYWWWLGDRWISGSSAGLERYLRKRDSNPIILYGRWARSEMFQKIQREVHGEIEHEKISQKEDINASRN